MKLFKLISIIPLMFILTSCIGEEPNDIAYITALGIDKADTGYMYTIQFANPKRISGGASEEGGSGENIVENITVQTPTLYSCISNANAIVSKDFSMSHAKIIVVSEEVAAEGLGYLNDTLARNNEVRPEVFIAVAENAQNYLEEVKPVIEVNPAKYYQLTYENKNGSRIPQNPALEFYFSCMSKKEDCVIPYAGVAKAEESSSETSSDSKSENKNNESIVNKSHSEAELNETGFENMTLNHYAGQAGVSITNKSEAMGLAVFRGDKYIGKMGSIEAEMYNMLIGKFREESITFYSDETPEIPVTIKIEQKKKPEYVIDKEKRTVKIKIRLSGELQTVSEQSKQDMSIDEFEIKASDMVSEAAESFIEKLYHEMGVDPLGVRGRLKKEFLTYPEYEEYCKTFDASKWGFDVETELMIKRTGMTYMER